MDSDRPGNSCGHSSNLVDTLPDEEAVVSFEVYHDKRPAQPHHKSSLRVIESPALFSSRLIDRPVKAIETETKPTASTGSALDPSMVSSASETNTSTIIGETIIRLMIV